MPYTKFISILFFSFLLASTINVISYTLDPVFVLYILGFAGALSFWVVIKNALQDGNRKSGVFEFILYGLILSILIAVILQEAFIKGVTDYNGLSSSNMTIGIAIRIVCYMLIGAVLQDIKICRFGLLPIFVLAVVFVLFASLTEGGFLINYYAMNQQRPHGDSLDHLTLTEPFIYVFAICLALSKRRNSLVAWGIVISCLFMAGGRGTFFAFVIFYIFQQLKTKRDYLTLAFMCVGIIAISFSSMVATGLNSDDVKHMFFAGEIQNDESYQARSDIFSTATTLLFSQTLYGDPSLIASTGGLGSYAHNAISIWQFFGITPFLLSLMAIVVIGRRIYNNNIEAMDPMSYAAYLTFFISSFSLIAFKSLMFYPFWFSIGFWLMRFMNENKGSVKR